MQNSVCLDKSRCTGCTACVKSCPTEAIRVVRGKAIVSAGLCIDCGRCVTDCPHNAFIVKTDSFSEMEKYKYNIAMPSAALFGQFRNLTDANIILEGLIALGFDNTFDVAAASEMLGGHWRDKGMYVLEGEKPRLTSCCPAVLRLIALRFPDLLDNLIDDISPIELAAVLARREAVEATGLAPEEIGVCYIAPCPAEVTRAKNPIGFDKPVIDYVLPLDEVYLRLLNTMKQVKEPRQLLRTGKTGLTWSRSGGISACFGELDAMGADGLSNVIEILEDIEDDKLSEAVMVDLDCCTQSCFGGCLCPENPYTAKMRMKNIVLPLPEKRCVLPKWAEDCLKWEKPLEQNTSTRLSQDFSEALKMQAEADRVLKTLPLFDCGSCGAPSCSAFAEDVARGIAQEGDCIYNIIKKMRNREKEDELDEFLPPPFRKPIEQ